MRFRALCLFLVMLVPPLAAAGGADPHAAKDVRNFTWVEEGILAVGGGGLVEADVDWLHGAGFRAIADFRAEHSDPAAYIEGKGIAFLDMPIDSASDLNETQFASFVEWARGHAAAGRPIYIHCTNGWHRAAAFAIAWELAEMDKEYEQAARDAMQRRPGTAMRAVAGLLDYQASLSGTPQLAVVLGSPLSHPGLGGTMPAYVDVHADGAPAANAHVLVWGEESKLRIEGVTDANGRFHFGYVAPANAFMDHLYARASLDGYADGADNVEFIFQQAARSRGALEVTADRTPEGLSVRATHEGRPLPIRIVANAPGWTEFEASARGEVLFRDAPAGAEVTVRAVAWGSEGGTATVDAVPGAPPPAATSSPPPLPRNELAAERDHSRIPGAPPVETFAPAPPPKHEDPRVLAVHYATAALVGAAGLALYVVLSRRRSGIGNR